VGVRPVLCCANITKHVGAILVFNVKKFYVCASVVILINN